MPVMRRTVDWCGSGGSRWFHGRAPDWQFGVSFASGVVDVTYASQRATLDSDAMVGDEPS
jgi:hypothetical protein